MKFEIERKNLLKGLSLIQGVVEKKKTLPILLNVLIETIEDKIVLTATDLEIGIKNTYDSKIIEPGKITVNAKKIFEIIKELPDEIITIKSKENNWIEIKCRNSKFNILALSPDEFPSINSNHSKNSIFLPSKKLNEMIDKTFNSMSIDETKYNLNGIFLHKTEDNNLRVISTDGHRLTLFENELSFEKDIFEKGIIIPRKGITELKKITETIDDDLEISLSDNNLVISNKEILLVIRLIDGDFPDYKRVIPTNLENSATINTSKLLQALRRISILANEKSRGINLVLSKDKLELNSSNPEYGNASDFIDIDYDGLDINIGFNAKYLLDALTNIDTENIQIFISDNISPCLITQENNKSYQAVIMPMRL